MKFSAATLAALLFLVRAATSMAAVTDADFGKFRDGTPVRIYTITNKSGSSVRLIPFGAAIQSLSMPDRSGKLADVVLGFDNMDGYLGNDPSFGAVIGRYANRIAGAAFPLDGTTFKLTANDRTNTLHGGRRGFDKVLWTPARIDDQSVEFTYLSKDAEEGFPGNLTAKIRYTLNDANELKLEYSATTDKDTVVNLSNHSYFNLAGEGNGDVLKNELTIHADQFTPVDALSIPAGQFVDVAGTPFDFRDAHPIGQRIAASDPQLRRPNGYDENFVLVKGDGVRPAATVYEPTSGRVLEVSTDQPGLQLYTSNGLNGSIAGKGGKRYPRYAAVCLEPGHFPDSPNNPEFPSTELKPGETYHTTTIYKFTSRTVAATQAGPVDLTTGWTLLHEGAAIGTIEQDAKTPTNSNPHLLRISETLAADPGEGRVGATSATHLAVQEGQWYDVTFSASTERGTIGLIFSLETSDGKVLARTTLPEIGGARADAGRGRSAPTTSAQAWPEFLVSLHARASDSSAHVTITPIEPTNIWLDGLTLTPRPAAH